MIFWQGNGLYTHTFWSNSDSDVSSFMSDASDDASSGSDTDIDDRPLPRQQPKGTPHNYGDNIINRQWTTQN